MRSIFRSDGRVPEKEFEKFIQEEETIRGKLDEHYEEVMESSKKNIVYVSEIVDEIVGE